MLKQTHWMQMPENDAEIEKFVKGISWKKEDQCRTALFNLIVPIVGNNVDLCLFNREQKDLTNKKIVKDILNSPASYIALGELKGGIDLPALMNTGKQQEQRLDRIQESFKKVGSHPASFSSSERAIETKMAVEIWNLLKKGTLSNAANLTDDDQIASLSRWLCNL